jgi:hypothetical protein
MTDRNRDQAADGSVERELPSAGGRGERFDEAQGGGRSWQDVEPSAVEADDLADDQAAHQDRGQSEADAEFNAESD